MKIARGGALTRLKLYFSGRLAREGNYLDQTLQLLWELETKGVDFELINTDGWTKEQFRHLYDEAVGSAGRNRYAIKEAFGSRSDGRSGFGKYVPALFIHDEAGRCVAVYPHLKGGRMVQIPEYLVDLLRGREGLLGQ